MPTNKYPRIRKGNILCAENAHICFILFWGPLMNISCLADILANKHGPFRELHLTPAMSEGVFVHAAIKFAHF